MPFFDSPRDSYHPPSHPPRSLGGVQLPAHHTVLITAPQGSGGRKTEGARGEEGDDIVLFEKLQGVCTYDEFQLSARTGLKVRARTGLKIPRVGVVNDEFSPEAEGISLVSPGKRNLVEEFLLDRILLVEHLLRYAARGSVDGYLPGVGLLHQSRVETNTQTHT